MYNVIAIICIVGILGGVAQAQDQGALNYVAKCREKNGARHFGLMLGSPRACNSITCTGVDAVQAAGNKLWDDARARGACIVWKPTRIQYVEENQSSPGVAAYADDNQGKQIGIVLNNE